ncbi:hypothetical protein GF357_00830 [Candidatus Dojkabacteria bacterium]|nr:hypothetical protein [Candidatus Dojkabacteria bacterium]
MAMEKKNTTENSLLGKLIPFFAALIVLVGGLYFINSSSQSEPESYTYSVYVSPTCPHCRNVKEFVEKNNVNDYLDIGFLSTSNSKNANKLMFYCSKKGTPLDQCGVPLLYDREHDEIVSGDTPIIDHLKKVLPIEVTE